MSRSSLGSIGSPGDIGPALPSAVEDGGLALCVREAVRSEFKQIQGGLHAELKDIRDAIGKLSTKRAPARSRNDTNQSEALAATAAAAVEMASHAWVSRNMRTYAAAAELQETESGHASHARHGMGPSHSTNSGLHRGAAAAHLQRKATGETLSGLRKQRTTTSIEAPISHAVTFAGDARHEGEPKCAWGDAPAHPAAPHGELQTSRSSSYAHMLSEPSSGACSRPLHAPTDSPHMHNSPSLHSVGVPPAAHSVLPTIPTMPVLQSMGTCVSRLSFSFSALSVVQSLCLRVVRNMYFESLTLCCIMINAVMIGVHTEYAATNLVETVPDSFDIISLCTGVYFTIEIVLRLIAFRRGFFTNSGWQWNVLDLVVVLLQIIEEVTTQFTTDSSNMSAALGLMRLMRILRLIRLVRIMRLLRYITELRTIVVSIASSVKPLASTVILLALVIYIVAICLTQLALSYRIDAADSVAVHDLTAYFGSVGIASLSIFQTVTGGLEWRHIVAPLMHHISPVMGFVYAMYIVFVSLAVMNIVTGVFVETALQRGREDKDIYMINQLRDLFGLLDANGNGMISLIELEEHLDSPKLEAFLKEIDIDVSEARNLFLLLDRDSDGRIDADEFLSGCLRLRGPAKSLDMQLVMRELAAQRKVMQGFAGALQAVMPEA